MQVIGVDLKFPHHENEIAVAEARYDNHPWVNYFIRVGDLTYGGCKMSESSKNIVNISTILKVYQPRQIRLLFLLNSFSSSLEYSDHQMNNVLKYEAMIDGSISNIKKRLANANDSHFDCYKKFNQDNLKLYETYQLVRKFLLRADSIKKRYHSKEHKKLTMTIKFSRKGTSKSPAKICKKRFAS